MFDIIPKLRSLVYSLNPVELLFMVVTICCTLLLIQRRKSTTSICIHRANTPRPSTTSALPRCCRFQLSLLTAAAARRFVFSFFTTLGFFFASASFRSNSWRSRIVKLLIHAAQLQIHRYTHTHTLLYDDLSLEIPRFVNLSHLLHFFPCDFILCLVD